MKIPRPLRSLQTVIAFLLTASPTAVFGAPAASTIMREGQARYHLLDPSKLPPGTDPKLFAAVVSGNSFDVFVRELPAQPITIELGFVDTESTGPGQHTFAVDANGTPLDANLDVFSKAGGADKPWVLKTTFNHDGGALAVHFVGLDKPAFVSYARFLDAVGKELAFGGGTKWEKSERLTLLDSRSRPFHTAKVGEEPFFDVDHSPVGAWSTFIYGMEQSGGVQVCKQPGGDGTLIPDQGVIMAVKNGATERVMPFTANQKPLPAGVLVTAQETTRTLGPCTDHWQIPGGVSWTHYTPVWAMKDWDQASLPEKRRFVLPVTWMRYRFDNRAGKEETQFLFSLQQAAQRAQGWDGFEGYVVDGDSAIAVKTGEAELLTADQAKKDFGLDGANSAFCVHVAPGSTKEVTFYVVQYKHGVESELEKQPLTMMCDALYADINDILKTAETSLPTVVARCQEMDRKLANSAEDDERKFLCADTLHSYQYNTIMHATPKKEPVWAVIEGECSCINTFDLTVDHVFYELAMHPWTVRNELDNFLNFFSFTDELSLPGQTQLFPGGLGFSHDMGSRLKFTNRETGAVYPNLMTQEELQNWILCSALYWKATGDDAWLQANKEAFNRALVSMQRRDDVDPAKRDGITTYMSHVGARSREITTYDAMDASLQRPVESLYIAVKSFASYTMLKPVFAALREPNQEQQAAAAEAYTAKGLLSHWDENRQCFPAAFNGTSSSAIIPAIEGLIYPYVMGLAQDVSPDGPNADFIRHLKTHMASILVPGVCIDAKTKGWNLSSSSSTTWLSKVYLNQFITENILGIKNAATGHDADAAHYAYEVLGAPAVGWTDQIYTSSHIAYGCRHYPRGVTSALWWLYTPDGKAR